MQRCDRAATWQRLQTHFDTEGRALDMREAFTQDTGRFDHFSQQAPQVFADLSKNLWTRETEALLLQLAQECGVLAQRDAMLRGDPINRTEARAVLHTLLRRPKGLALPGDRPEIADGLAQVHVVLERMLDFAEGVRADARITDIVNIGIGGSDLGPAMAVRALGDWGAPDKRIHFVSNIDAHELSAVLRDLRPESTLFLVASKTFTTAETMQNARSALAWFAEQGGRDIARHFIGLTANADAAQALGVRTCFEFWDWVGGRYSVWSAIGLALAIAVGRAHFQDFLAGAHAMDEHFRTAPDAQNLPLRMGLLDLWYRNFHGFASRCIAPYHAHLARLPAYLQQLEMESNGKRVDADGAPLAVHSAPVLWGEPGTNGQHAFFQLLHQGTEPMALEIVAVRQAAHPWPGHQEKLLANALAQAQALMVGCTNASGAHRQFPGNRPSSFLLLDALTPRSLGALLALQEHRVFVTGCLWGINSFDQWGVELGKVLASDLETRLHTGDATGLDASTAGLLWRMRSA